MYSSSVPWKVLSSSLALGVITEGWSLAELPADTQDVRSFTFEVFFDSPFFSVPVVQVAITGFDIDQRDSARLTVRADGITESGFTVVISTWADTRIYATDLNWIAIGP